MKFGIVIDSASYISKEIRSEYNLEVVPLNVIAGENSYLDEIEIKNSTLMDMVDQGIQASTSQPSPDLFLKAYEKVGKEYDEIVVITMSSKLSGTYQSAVIAKDLYDGKSKIHVIDTLSASAGEELVILKLIELNQASVGAEEAVRGIKELINDISLNLVIDDLNTLIRTGRLTKGKALIGSLLNVKPILKVEEGKVVVDKSVRTMKRVFTEFKNRVEKDYNDKGKQYVRIVHINSLQEAEMLKNKIQEISEKINVEVSGEIGPVVSVHLGKGALGISWVTWNV